MGKAIPGLLCGILLSGCANYTWIPAHPDNPDFAPIAPENPSIAPNFSGSIYHENYGVDSYYTDLRAHRVGDILTVVLIETTSASKAATTNAAKTTAVNIQDPVILNNVYPALTQLNSNSNFNGTGNSAQNNNLQGKISVTVAHVLNNGNLVVRGEKWISLNQGSEYIRLTGIVRPFDIDADNNVLSTKIANPRISYRGTGVLAEANQEGWLARFFNGPLFPY